MQDPIGIFRVLELSASLSYRARRAAESKLREKGLTFAQYGALAALAARDGLSQAELALALETDSTTAMVLRGSLEKKGFVDRVADPADGRVRRISLTAQGEAVLGEARPLVEELWSGAGELFSEAEIKRLLPLLERLREFAGAAMPAPADAGEPKRRGRPRKDRPAEEPTGEPKRRGRPRKAAAAGEEEVAEKPAPKKRAKKAAEPAAAPKAPKAKRAKKAAEAPAPKAGGSKRGKKAAGA